MGISFNKKLFACFFVLAENTSCSKLQPFMEKSSYEWQFCQQDFSDPEENLLSKGKVESDKPTEAYPLQSCHQLDGKATLNAVLP